MSGHLIDRAETRAETPPASPERLPPGWICGRDCDIGGHPGRPVCVDFVLMHPQIGIALVDLADPTPDAATVLRERLEEARFSAIFGGYLPVVHGSFMTVELPFLIAAMGTAFAEQAPLSLPGGGAWVTAVARVVMPLDRRWTDNLEGAPSMPQTAAGDATLEGAAWASGRPADFIPLRRVASIRAAATVPQPAPVATQPGPKRWRVAAAGAGLFTLAVLAGSWLSQTQRVPVAATPAEAVPIALLHPAPVAEAAVDPADAAPPAAAPEILPLPTAAPPRPPAGPVARQVAQPTHGMAANPVRQATTAKPVRPARANAVRLNGRT